MDKNILEQQKEFEDIHDYKFMNKVPVIIRVDGRNFTKITNQLPKPFCERMSLAMTYTMVESIKQIDGAIFGFSYTDEMTFIIFNNDNANPWFNNKIQKIISNTASICTYSFTEYLQKSIKPPNIIGQTIFECQSFTLPNVTETIKYLIARQQDCYEKAVTSTVVHVLSHHYDLKKIKEILFNKNISDRIDILSDYNINFETDYPNQFKFGIGLYRAKNYTEKNKWYIDENLPLFIDDRKFLVQLLTTGSDIFRPNRIFEKDFNISND